MKTVTLMYHDITDQPETSGFAGADADLYKISVAEFDNNLREISRRITHRPQLVKDWQTDVAAFFITFDDGGKSALQAAEILEKYNWRGHFFITTGKIGTAAFVGAQDIKELCRRGHLVGSHSDSHPLRMASLSRRDIFSEWKISTEKLADLLGEKVETASVPGGLFSREVAECAEENGIRFLFNSEPTAKVKKIGNCFIFGRYSIQNGFEANEIAAIAAGKLAPRFKQTLIWNIKKPLKKLGGNSFLKIRKYLINQRTENKK